MEFKELSIEAVPKIKDFLYDSGEETCEITPVNLVFWQPLYKNEYLIKDNILLLKSSFEQGDIFSLPFGDMEKGLDLIREYSNLSYPSIWAQDGKRFESFISKYSQFYNIEESRNEFDYIYNRENLASLAGKKYHSKRNHISAFSKQFDWRYEEINADNVLAVQQFAQRWYEENLERSDVEMMAERNGVMLLLQNMGALNISGGMIKVSDEIAAFTLASAINDRVYDIHIEKALPPFLAAYSVINREFARRLPESCVYINREDDLGLEGLRRSKLSYHPEKLVKKYICLKKENL